LKLAALADKEVRLSQARNLRELPAENIENLNGRHLNSSKIATIKHFNHFVFLKCCNFLHDDSIAFNEY